jgi:energy-converting hydrogenase Eha subunit C
MTTQPFDRITKTALLAAGLLFILAGAGWAYWGTDIFLTAVMAGLAYCF